MPTNIPFGSRQAITLQSVALFAANMQRGGNLNRLAGAFPQEGDADNTIRRQSSNKMPIVRCMDLTKTAGERITFDFVNPTGGKPIMGSRVAEGRGRAMSFDQDEMKLNQWRYPISAGDTMSQQRTPHQLRVLARSLAQSFADRYKDQSSLVHLAGARGFHDNIEWAVPLASDPDFAEIMINPVKAPTRNRHYMSTGSGIETVKASGNEITLANTDLMNIDVLDGIRTLMDGMALPPPPVEFPGDKMAGDSPLRVLLVSPEQYTSILRSNSNQFRTFQANAMARAQVAGMHPIFMGDSVLWNGVLVVKMPKPIRFYAGNPINWCPTITAETETTTDLVPASFGTSYAVDRAILLGGQALAECMGRHKRSGAPFFWSEKLLDHDDKEEILIGGVGAYSKVRFDMNYGETTQPTDHGVIAIDTVVALQQ
jgi:N4-gp56 family major capsid protein